MLFNSVAFLVFLPSVWMLYHAVRRPMVRVVVLLAASYLFYAWWRVDYLALLVVSTLTDYACGLALGRWSGRGARRTALAFSLIINLGLLATFKYWSFIGEQLVWMSDWLGPRVHWPALDVLLPVGISFYTFQTLSYTIDVYRRRVEPERNVLRFALYVSFFPQLVAGPIERPQRLLPQLREPGEATTDQLVSGLRLMLWGMFKKVVVADRLALYVDVVYGNPTGHNGTQLTLATLFFAIQIYCDFSGYTDIAIGCARTLGFDLMKNFRRPYLAWSPAEFWRRWHISLSTWFGDYVYKPLGGSRCSASRASLNLMLTFLVSGLWHGANWTFILWGGVHGLLVLVERAYRRVAGLSRDAAPTGLVTRAACTVVTLAGVVAAWVFFRAPDAPSALYILSHLPVGWARTGIACGFAPGHLLLSLILCAVVVVYDIGEESGVKLPELGLWDVLPRPARWAGYWSLATSLLLVGQLGGGNQFIYFQF